MEAEHTLVAHFMHSSFLPNKSHGVHDVFLDECAIHIIYTRNGYNEANKDGEILTLALHLPSVPHKLDNDNVPRSLVI